MTDASKKPSTAVGSELSESDVKRMKVGTPPVIFEAQNLGYIELERPEELAQWQEDLLTTYGMDKEEVKNYPGIRGETCCCIRGQWLSDRCDAA